jgi:hypothetical protein
MIILTYFPSQHSLPDHFIHPVRARGGLGNIGVLLTQKPEYAVTVSDKIKINTKKEKRKYEIKYTII